MWQKLNFGILGTSFKSILFLPLACRLAEMKISELAFARLGTSCMSAIGSVVGLLGPRNRNRKDRPAGPAKYAI